MAFLGRAGRNAEPMLQALKNKMMIYPSGQDDFLGTIQAINSESNIRGFERMQPQDEQGKPNEYRLYFKRSSLGAGIEDENGTDDLCSVNNTIEPFAEVHVDKNLANVTKDYWIVDPEKIRDIKDLGLAEYRAEEMADRLKFLRRKINQQLYTAVKTLAAAFYAGGGTAPTLPVDWPTTAATPFAADVLNADHSVNMAGIHSMLKMLRRNQFAGTPIMIHSYGAIYDYQINRSQSAYCCNQNGVDPNQVANLFQYAPYFDSTLDLAGESINETIMFEPGSIHFRYKNYNKGEAYRIDMDHLVKTTLPDPEIGVEWDYVLRYDECAVNAAGRKGQWIEGLELNWEPFVKPVKDSDTNPVNRGVLENTNQVIVANLTQAA